MSREYVYNEGKCILEEEDILKFEKISWGDVETENVRWLCKIKRKYGSRGNIDPLTKIYVNISLKYIGKNLL